MTKRKRWAFAAIFTTILATVTLVGVEFLASFYTPSWPARVMNPREPAPVRVLAAPFKRQPWLAQGDNSWGMRDQERTLAKPPETFRTVVVGDSFVESWFTPLSLPAAVEQRLATGDRKAEAVSLGVAATDPRSYYYRIRDVALELQPDAIVVVIYAGNDFVPPGQGPSMWPRLVDESPGASIVGSIMPRTNWLLVNRLDLAAFFKSRSTAPANDEAMLFAAVTAPEEEHRLKRLVDYVKKYHYPNVPEQRLAEILSRGDKRYLNIALPSDGEQEYLLDWMLGVLMSWEARDFDWPTNRADIARTANNGEVEATFGWIEAMDRLTRRHGVPLLVFVAPMGSVDPDYAEFWKPWPRTYSWNHVCDERHSQLLAALSKTNIRYFDLRETLANIPGTYRKLDGHWSQKGEAIVADRIAAELKSLMNKPQKSAQVQR